MLNSSDKHKFKNYIDIEYEETIPPSDRRLAQNVNHPFIK